MTLPLASTIEFTAAAELAIAFVLGTGFGFSLERAGFGSARKLTAVFYLYDMAVVKVMFTAIVTAMTGLFVLSAAGQLDLTQLYVEATSFPAQALGGLIFGAGFIAAYGARLAKGCTSGQALTGGAILNVGSLVFMLAVFAAAYGLAYFLRKEWL